MKFCINSDILQKYPNLFLGVIVAKNISNDRQEADVDALLKVTQKKIQKEFTIDNLKDHPHLKIWRETYKSFGAEPNKYRSSSDALIRQVLNGREISHINTLVDLYNYISLKYILTVGGEDLNFCEGDIQLSFANGNEDFSTIGSNESDPPKAGEVVYKDAAGVICRRWNWREADRTKLTENTKNVVMVIEGLPPISNEVVKQATNELADLVKKYCGGDVAVEFLDKENQSIDLGVMETSLKNHHPLTPSSLKEGGIPSPQARGGLGWGGELAKNNTDIQFIDKNLLKFQIDELVSKTSQKLFPNAAIDGVVTEYPKDSSHGDYSTNIALQLAAQFNKKPRDIAQKIVDELSSTITSASSASFSKIDIAGPGFINFWLADSYLTKTVMNILEEKENFGQLTAGQNKKVIVEYSDPNIAKPLGIHHVLATIIGQALANMYDNLGFSVWRVNYIGDWGTQFGKLCFAYKNWGDKNLVEKNPIPELLKLYVRFHNEAEKDPKLEDNGREEFRKLELGDAENTELWRWFVEVSMKDVQKTYDLLGGIAFDEIKGESAYRHEMQPILDEGMKKGVFKKGNEGALIVEFENEKYPTCVVQKKDGGTVYLTRDLAVIDDRKKRFKPWKALYVVDIAQQLYFQQLLETARLLGRDVSAFEHVAFGRMSFPEGKMSTRKGTVILLDEVLEEAVERALKIVEAKNPDLPEKEKKAVARIVGIGAVKYSVLAQNRLTNITFTWEKMLALDGNSAPYLQYTYARARSILRKSVETGHGLSLRTMDFTDDKEKAVARLLGKYPEYILAAAEDYRPNTLANYLYELTQAFNTFYTHLPVVQADDEKIRSSRLALVEAVTIVLKNGLGLLGIEVPERM